MALLLTMGKDEDLAGGGGGGGWLLCFVGVRSSINVPDSHADEVWVMKEWIVGRVSYNFIAWTRHDGFEGLEEGTDKHTKTKTHLPCRSPAFFHLKMRVI